MDLLILITLGTQDKKFYRLLDAVQKLIDNKIIQDEVIVQAGCSSDFKSKDMKIFDLIDREEFSELISKCDLLITHGGVGSILTGLKNNKKVIFFTFFKLFLNFFVKIRFSCECSIRRTFFMKKFKELLNEVNLLKKYYFYEVEIYAN